jgi:two-component system cell cycle response regulator CpdR
MGLMDKPMILLVEDEPLILDIVREALEDGGTAATDGESAQEALASGAPFQGLVADVFLPGGLNGWDLARIARAALPHIAVVYATGHGELDWPVEGVPGSALLAKPYAPAQVVAALALQLNAVG